MAIRRIRATMLRRMIYFLSRASLLSAKIFDEFRFDGFHSFLNRLMCYIQTIPKIIHPPLLVIQTYSTFDFYNGDP